MADAYETRWRARAAEHGITDVDWYIYVGYGPHYWRYADEAQAERMTLLFHGEPYCGRGAHCADICPHLMGTSPDGYFSSVEALLDDCYDDD